MNNNIDNSKRYDMIIDLNPKPVLDISEMIKSINKTIISQPAITLQKSPFCGDSPFPSSMIMYFKPDAVDSILSFFASLPQPNATKSEM